MADLTEETLGMSTAAELELQSRPLAPVPAHVPEHLVFDFDIYHDPRIQKDIQQGYMQLHQDAPDIFYSRKNGGYWIVTRFAEATHILTNPKIFSSGRAFVRPTPPEKAVTLVPIHMDAPDHMRYRMPLLKFLALTPKEVKKWEPVARDLINELLDGLQGRHGCEFRSEIAVPMPVKLFLGVLHWDINRFRDFNRWVDEILASQDVQKAQPAYASMNQYLTEMIQSRIDNPGDDPVSMLLASEVNGEKMAVKRVHEICTLLFVAGLDTVANSMTFIMYHLAQYPDVQQRLRANPDLAPAAVEEFLRRYSFVNTPRRVVQDTEVGGVFMKEGDVVVCGFAACSNDPRSVQHPESLDLERKASPHLAFSTGPHNCAGATLARLELRIFLQEWLRRMPDVRLAPGFVPQTRGGSVMGLKSLDITW
jgi:cytochrome P450